MPYPPKPTGELPPNPVFKPILGITCSAEVNTFYCFLVFVSTIMTVLFFRPRGPTFYLSLSTFPLCTSFMLYA